MRQKEFLFGHLRIYQSSQSSKVPHPRYLQSFSHFKNYSYSNFTDRCWIFDLEKNSRVGVPDKYFVITNNEIIRVRYLIVYGTEMIKSEHSNVSECSVHENSIIQWILRHKWLTAMVTYALILLIIGASNSRSGFYMRQFMRQATRNAINYIKTFDILGFNLIQQLFDWPKSCHLICQCNIEFVSKQLINGNEVRNWPIHVPTDWRRKKTSLILIIYILTVFVNCQLHLISRNGSGLFIRNCRNCYGIQSVWNCDAITFKHKMLEFSWPIKRNK